MENEEKKEIEKQSENWREPFFQRLRGMGIEVIDMTDEWQGKTTLITLYRPSYKSQPDKEQSLPTDIKKESE